MHIISFVKSFVKKKSIIFSITVALFCNLAISYSESADTILKTNQTELDTPTNKALLDLHAQTIRDLFQAQSHQLPYKNHPNLAIGYTPANGSQPDNVQPNSSQDNNSHIDPVLQNDPQHNDLCAAILQSQQLTSEKLLSSQDKLLASQEIAAKAMLAGKVIDNAPTCTLCICVFAVVGVLINKYG